MSFNVTLSNVENLYGIDVIVRWNSTALQVLSATSVLGVESHPTGVLHETVDYPIITVEDNATQEIGEYHLVATSQGSADSFNGSGTIATLTFNITNAGRSDITVQSELADHPLVGETTSELIAHNDLGGSVDAVPIPEFTEIAVLSFLVVIVSAVLLYSKKLSAKRLYSYQSTSFCA